MHVHEYRSLPFQGRAPSHGTAKTFKMFMAMGMAIFIAINGDGDVLMNLHDPTARFPTMTGVLETREALYLTTLFGEVLPRIYKRDL